MSKFKVGDEYYVSAEAIEKNSAGLKAGIYEIYQKDRNFCRMSKDPYSWIRCTDLIDLDIYNSPLFQLMQELDELP